MSFATYRNYRRALKAEPFTGCFMPYGWSPLPDRLGAQWLAYSEMLGEFSRGLANVINDLTHAERRLRAWAQVVAPLSDRAKLNATHEFIDPVAIVAVNLPYVIRARFAFAAAHLCHQANQVRVEDWQDDLPLDSELTSNQAGRVGRPWKRYGRLQKALDVINGADYVEATRNFRNVYTHRLEPRFVIGITGVVTRRPKPGGAIYEIGGQPALDLSEVAAALVVQRDRCYAAFENFRALVEEHGRAIADTASAS